MSASTATAGTLRDAALFYHAAGLTVVPVDQEKHALVPWGHWRERRQTEAEVRALPWDRAHGLALLTWPALDLVILDFDGPHAEGAWRQTGITLPETGTNRTRSGGTHLIFRVPDGTPRPGANGQGHRRKVRLVVADCECQKPCGVDLLVNGYFIVPPTPGYSEDPDHPLEPGTIATIPQEVLSLARRTEKPDAGRTTVATDGGWFAAAMRGPIPEGTRNDTATRLAGLLLAKGLSADHVKAALELWARTVCVPPMDLQELRATVESVARREATKANAGEAPAVVCLADVTPEAVRWLWPGRIAQGKLTLIIGDPDKGKSCVTLDLAARVSTGLPWPDGTPAPCGDVVLLTAEDGLSDTVRPRLDAMGGDPSRVHALTAIRTGDRERGFDLTRDLEHLEAELGRTGAILVVIDPVSAYLGRADSYRDAEVRGILAPLAALAERTSVAIVGVMHLTKDAQRKVLYRAQGSLAFVAASRAVFAVAEDKDNPERRLFLPVKNNLGPKPPGLAFRLLPSGSAARVEWDADPVTVDAEAALAGPEPPQERGEREEAQEFLGKVLADGPVASEDVKRQARAAGIAERTLFRAKHDLGVKADKDGFRGGWVWSLSPKAAKAATPAYIGYGGNVGSLRGPEAPAEVEL
jgi:hypothetical protein